MPSRLIWPAVQIATAVALVVVPFGYAITGVHTDVLLGAGCGIAIGVGVGLRGGSASGAWTGILSGSILGIATALIAGLIAGNPWGLLGPPILALAVGLIDGLGQSSLSGYREVTRETCIVAVLLTVGLFPAMVALDVFGAGIVSRGTLVAVLTLLLIPTTALVAGLVSQRREGWRDTRPPTWLLLGAVPLPALLALLMVTGVLDEGGLADIVVSLTFSLVVLPAVAFLAGRAATIWLRPRLRVYGQLADYLRVMWVPIGGFAVGYLTIIVLFAGFYGMLERFSPAAFADAGTGIVDWISFAFFTALGQDYATVAPVSVSARALVGAHLILSAGWAVVLFAAVMSSIGPKLERIARHHATEDADSQDADREDAD